MKRNLFLAAAIVCVIALIACGSLAYYTAQHEVTNKFMTASYDPDNPDDPVDPSELFSVLITETASADGTNTDADDNFLGNNYKNVYPGLTIAKDPVITNTGDYAQFIRATVTFDKASEWQTALGDGVDIFDSIVTDLGDDSAKWKRSETVAKDEDLNTVAYTFYYIGTTEGNDADNGKLAPGAFVQLFKAVTIPSSLTSEDMAPLSNFTINVKADAVQADGTGTDAEATFGNPTYWPAG